MALKRGSLIKVRAFGGKEIVRRFLAKHEGTVLICSEEEYRSAQLEKREPMCVGFPVADVVEPKTRNILNLRPNDQGDSRRKHSAQKGRAN